MTSPTSSSTVLEAKLANPAPMVAPTGPARANPATPPSTPAVNWTLSSEIATRAPPVEVEEEGGEGGAGAEAGSSSTSENKGFWTRGTNCV